MLYLLPHGGHVFPPYLTPLWFSNEEAERLVFSDDQYEGVTNTAKSYFRSWNATIQVFDYLSLDPV